MKQAIILIVLASVSFAVNAQKKQNVYFLNKKGKEVAVRDSADYMRIIQEPDPGEKNYVLYEFYMDDKRKSEGRVSSFTSRLAYEGLLVSYDRNGIKTSRINYENGFRKGMAYYYYANGKLKKQVEFIPRAAGPNQIVPINLVSPITKVIFQQDSLGVVAIQDGNGHVIEKSEIGKQQLIEEGDYKNGFRDGIWKGNYTDGHMSFEETYQNGKVINGESVVQGKKYQYNVPEAPPEFDGGTKAWGEFIVRSTKYPVNAQRGGISGTVHTSFTIDTQGRITDIKIVKSVDEALDNEAKRVLQTSPRWTPGQQRGVPVKVRYSQAFRFNPN